MSEAGSQPPEITVPEKHAVALSRFAGLPEDKQNSFYLAASEIRPSPQAWDLLKELIDTSLDTLGGENKILAQAIMGVFYARQSSSDKNEGDFVKGVVQGIKRAMPKNDLEEGHLQKVLSNVLALRNLELVYRVGRIRFDHAHHMHDAGIVTDLRPIFDFSATKIECAVISHVLKIDYAGTAEEGRNLYLAVDDADLEKLEIAIKRARRKAAALKVFAGDANLKIFEDRT